MRLLAKTAVAALLLASTGMFAAPMANATPTPTPELVLSSCGAGCVSGTLSIGPSLTDWNTINNLGQFFFPKFDTSLGVLTSATITISGSISGSGTLVNNGPSSTTAKGFETTDFSLVGGPSAISTLSGSSVFNSSSYSLAASPGPGNTASFAIAGSIATLTYTGTDASLQAFGGGLDLVNILTETGQGTTGGGGNATFTPVTTAAADIILVYNYSPACTQECTETPEPASLTLLGASLVGLGAFVRRRRA